MRAQQLTGAPNLPAPQIKTLLPTEICTRAQQLKVVPNLPAPQIKTLLLTETLHNLHACTATESGSKLTSTTN